MRYNNYKGALLHLYFQLIYHFPNMFDISPTGPRQAGKLQPTLTNLVNIDPYSQKYIVTNGSAPVEHPLYIRTHGLEGF